MEFKLVAITVKRDGSPLNDSVFQNCMTLFLLWAQKKIFWRNPATLELT